MCRLPTTHSLHPPTHRRGSTKLGCSRRQNSTPCSASWSSGAGSPTEFHFCLAEFVSTADRDVPDPTDGRAEVSDHRSIGPPEDSGDRSGGPGSHAGLTPDIFGRHSSNDRVRRRRCLRTGPFASMPSPRPNYSGTPRKASTPTFTTRAKLALWVLNPLEQPWPVSYTHLDVYKRQPITMRTTQVPPTFLATTSSGLATRRHGGSSFGTTTRQGLPRR